MMLVVWLSLLSQFEIWSTATVVWMVLALSGLLMNKEAQGVMLCAFIFALLVVVWGQIVRRIQKR